MFSMYLRHRRNKLAGPVFAPVGYIGPGPDSAVAAPVLGVGVAGF